MAQYNNVEVAPSDDKEHLRESYAKLKYDKPMEKQGKRGPFYVYGCTDAAGKDASFLAFAEQHAAIKATGAGAGDVVYMAKVGSGPGEEWFVRKDGDPFTRGPGGSYQDDRNAPAGRGFDARLAQYNAALDVACEIAAHVENTRAMPGFAHLDVNAVAFTLMKMADDTNTDLTKRGDAPG